MPTANEGQHSEFAAESTGRIRRLDALISRVLRSLRRLSLTTCLAGGVTLGLIVAVNAHGRPNPPQPNSAFEYRSGMPWACLTQYAQAGRSWNFEPGNLKEFFPGAAFADAVVWLTVLAIVVWAAARWRRWLGQPPRTTRWVAVLTFLALLAAEGTGFAIDRLHERQAYMEHGFPLTYWTRWSDPKGGIGEHWAFRDVRYGWFNAEFFWIDLWLALTAVAAVTTFFELRRRRVRGRQVSLREFLALVAVAGLAAGWAARMREGNAIMVALDTLQHPPTALTETPGPEWIERLWTEDRLLQRGWFRISGSAKIELPDDAAQLHALQFLLSRYADHVGVVVNANAALERLKQLNHVQLLWLNCGEIGASAQLIEVIGTFPELRAIDLYGPSTGDDLLIALAGNGTLEQISAGGTLATQRGMAALAHLPRLKELLLYECDIRSLAIFDAGTFRSLTLLDLTDVPLADDEVAAFRRTHPTCTVRHICLLDSPEQSAE